MVVEQENVVLLKVVDVRLEGVVHQVVEEGDAHSSISISTYARHHLHLLVLYVQGEFLVNFDSLTSAAFHDLEFDTCAKVG